MDSREFVNLVRREAVDNPFNIIMKKLTTPRAPKPIAPEHRAGSPSESINKWFHEGGIKEQRQAAWFASLNADDQAILKGLIEECAELSGFGFFTLD